MTAGTTPIGRIVMEFFADTVPRTAGNVRVGRQRPTYMLQM